jgi:hypothetical protein
LTAAAARQPCAQLYTTSRDPNDDDETKKSKTYRSVLLLLLLASADHPADAIHLAEKGGPDCVTILMKVSLASAAIAAAVLAAAAAAARRSSWSRRGDADDVCCDEFQRLTRAARLQSPKQYGPRTALSLGFRGYRAAVTLAARSPRSSTLLQGLAADRQC